MLLDSAFRDELPSEARVATRSIAGRWLDPSAVSASEHLTRTVLRGHPNLRHPVRDTRSLQLRGALMDSLPYVSNDHHAPLISHTLLYSPGQHHVLRLVSCLRSWRVGARFDQFGGSSSSTVGCFTPCIQNLLDLPAQQFFDLLQFMRAELLVRGGSMRVCVGVCVRV